MQQKSIRVDVVVAGRGLSGVSAAPAAAPLGIATILLQDRPVLRGNSASEVRVTPHGAAASHHYARETGIASELFEERARNHEEIFENGWTVSDSYRRHRVQDLTDAGQVEALRITVGATNGDPAAAIYGVRCYGPEESVWSD